MQDQTDQPINLERLVGINGLNASTCLSTNLLRASLLPERSFLLAPSAPYTTVSSSTTSWSSIVVNGVNLQFYPLISQPSSLRKYPNQKSGKE
jgi:hypothetical protein